MIKNLRELPDAISPLRTVAVQGIEISLPENDEIKNYADGLWALDQAEAILAPFCREPDAEKTMQKIKDSISNPEVKFAFHILCLHSRSTFVARQTNNTAYAATRPGILTVAKKYHGIPYMDWNPHLSKEFLYLCGRGFHGLLPYCGLHKEYYEKFNIPEIYAKVSGEWSIKRSGDAEFDSLSAMFRRLLLRKWLFGLKVPYGVVNLDDWDDEEGFGQILAITPKGEPKRVHYEII